MFKHFRKQDETRASYTDTLISAILNRAAGTTANAAASSAVETAAGIVGRAFAGAKATGTRASALTPGMLMIMGRDLIRRGESLFLIDTQNDIRLLPVWTYNITGTYDPKTWSYECTLAGPSKTTTRKAPVDDVVHVKINGDSARPWRGNSAIDSASMVSDLLANTTASLRDEAGAPIGSFLPLPERDNSEIPVDAKNARGSLIAVESVMTDPDTKGMGDYEQRRFGPSPPDPLVSLLESSHGLMLAAIGISAALFSAKDAASATAAYRTFAHSLIGPLGRIAQAELASKLDDDSLTLDFADLKAANVAERAASLKRLVESGIDTDKALALSGLLAHESA